MESRKRPPIWTRDERILAFSFYIKHRPHIPEKSSQELQDLSKLLRSLGLTLHGRISENYRNPSGTYMKLMNFRADDPTYDGKGLKGGAKEDKLMWDFFGDNPEKLHALASTIEDNITSTSPKEILEISLDDTIMSEATEGTLLTRTHVTRERNPKLREDKIGSFKKTHGAVFCEACGFNFEETYGPRGVDFIECHHTKPLSELKAKTKTSLDDLALLCSNCHRMVHREKPWLTLEELKALVATNGT